MLKTNGLQLWNLTLNFSRKKKNWNCLDNRNKRKKLETNLTSKVIFILGKFSRNSIRKTKIKMRLNNIGNYYKNITSFFKYLIVNCRNCKWKTSMNVKTKNVKNVLKKFFMKNVLVTNNLMTRHVKNVKIDAKKRN